MKNEPRKESKRMDRLYFSLISARAARARLMAATPAIRLEQHLPAKAAIFLNFLNCGCSISYASTSPLPKSQKWKRIKRIFGETPRGGVIARTGPGCSSNLRFSGKVRGYNRRA
jgi:hypothetical protein